MEFNLFWDLLFVGGPFLTTTVSDSDSNVDGLGSSKHGGLLWPGLVAA